MILWTETDDCAVQGEQARTELKAVYREVKPTQSASRTYYPLVETFRLYGGWLLAWYCVVYALGNYQVTRSLPFHSSIIDDLFTSSLILHLSFATFLFLVLTSIHRLWGGGAVRAIFLCITGIALFTLFVMNM